MLGQRDPVATAAEMSARDGAAYVAEMKRLGAQMELFGRLTVTGIRAPAALPPLARLAWRLARRDGIHVGGDLLASSRTWLESRFEGPEAAHLHAPWVLHGGLDPDASGGAFLTQAMAVTHHAVGMPLVKGGADAFARAFRDLIAAHGGEVRTGTEVERILVRAGRVDAVEAGGERIGARRAVIANVTPTELHGRLLSGAGVAAKEARAAAGYRYNRRAGMQVHIALRAPLAWRDPRLGSVPIVHLSEGADQVALACAEAAAGLLPRRPTVVVGQPVALDPSRAPAGASILWIQLQEVPRNPVGDAAGEIEVGTDGWTGALVDAYVERVLDRIRPHVEDLDRLRLKTVALPPPEIERRVPNLVGGDFYAGDPGLDQSGLWRPFTSFGRHSTSVAGLYQCGATTFPGPGLNAASGRLAAQLALADADADAG